MSLFDRLFRRRWTFGRTGLLSGRTIPIDVITSCEAVIKQCYDVRGILTDGYRYDGARYRDSDKLVPPWRRYR